MASMKKLSKRGFTLIELMIVVVIIGILAALAIYGVQKYVANSKSAEARQMLGRISKDHLVAFESERQGYAILAPGGTAAISRTLCPDALGIPVPGIMTGPGAYASVAAIQATKWQPGADLFRDAAVAGGGGWECMKFSVTTPLYYGYGMDTTQAGVNPAAGDGFVAYAVGDLDGDGQPGAFELGGNINVGTVSNDVTLILATTVNEISPEE